MRRRRARCHLEGYFSWQGSKEDAAVPADKALDIQPEQEAKPLLGLNSIMIH